MIISISISKEIFDLLKTKDNRSKYIARLIQQDMEGSPKKDIDMNSIRDLLDFG